MKIISLPLTEAEAWHILHALSESNGRAAKQDSLEVRARTWIADRLLKLVEGRT